MHPISDKELDKLFQQGFEEVEFQPSSEIWRKITTKMDRKEKGSNSISVFWMAAASIVLILGAGFWFYRPVDQIMLQGVSQNIVQNIPNSPISDLGTGAAMLDTHQPEIKGFDFSKLVSSDEGNLTTQDAIIVPEKLEDDVLIAEASVSNNSSKRAGMEVDQSKKEVVVPRYNGDQSQLDVTQPDMIASVEVVQDDLVAEPEQSSAKRIKSVGSLVNFVISKVDRRDDKIIEFKDGNEGSQVSGINLGLIKLKSRIK